MLTITWNIIFSSKTVPFAVLLCLLFSIYSAKAQENQPRKNNNTQQPAKDTSKNVNENQPEKIIPADSTGKDTTAKFTDTLNIPISASALESQVKYKAKDSIIYDIANKKVYLYGAAHIEYQDIILDAAYITIDWNTNEISAEGRPDSTGKIVGNPVFKQAGQETKQKKITYNFKSKKGRINELMMQEGTEAFIHVAKGKTIKQDGKDVIFAKDAKYTTCNLEDPHFYIQTNKLKLIPKDKIITGPAMIYIEKVPIPLVLPFGFFPANSRKSSGIIIPSVGNAGTRGFALRDGGFYFGGSEYFDLALIGDIYTGGSYKTSIQSNYAKRYRFNGDIFLSYARIDNGQPRETRDYDINEEFNVKWSHFQNPKAHPGTSFNANVNIASSNYLKQTSFNANDIRTQNLQSSISYGKQFRGTPFNLQAALTHNQILNTGAIDFSLPNVNFNMNRINPFKGKNALQKRWYHDIGVTYNLTLQNQLRTSDKTIREDFTWEKFNTGARHSLPVSTAFRVFNYFSFSPSVGYDGYFYTKRITKSWNSELKKIDTFTERGFFYAQTYTTNASLSTLLYGMFNINRGRLVALRHQLTPSINFNYTPDFGAAKFGYYATYTDSAGNASSPYSIYETSATVAGYPGLGRSGTLGFNLSNNFEMKYKTKNDTANPTKKIKIFENLNFSGGYNFFADSLHFTPFTVFATTTLFDKIRVNGGATMDPYDIKQGVKAGTAYRVQEFVLDNRKALGRITNANLAFSTDFNAAAREDASLVASYNNPYIGYYYSQPYANFNIPWGLGLAYNLYYAKPLYEADVKQTVAINTQLNLTPKWKIAANGDYDIRNNKISFVQFNIFRDLHCWEMSFQWTPIGTAQSYFFNIHIKASSLKDLKLEKRPTGSF